jgi:hypothetical protein
MVSLTHARWDSTKAPCRERLFMITWILFGHLMTPGQPKTTTDVHRSRSGKTEVIASISKQRKQRSENQRISCCDHLAGAATGSADEMPTGRSRRQDRQPGRGREGSRRRFLLGDHLGTTRPARGRTTRTSSTRPHGICTQSDQYRCLLLRPGGQGCSRVGHHVGRRAATA